MQEVLVKGLENGVLCVELSGDIDLGNAEEFYAVVSQAYTQTPASLHFSCANLNFIDSTTLGTFVKILKMAKTDGNTEIKCPRCGAINRYSASDNTIECEPKEKSDQRSTSSGMTFR